jgi:hypothetical protein
MKTEFVNRSGERLVIEISIHDPCPECCGGLEPLGNREKPRAYRCRSCSLLFYPLEGN